MASRTIIEDDLHCTTTFLNTRLPCPLLAGSVEKVASPESLEICPNINDILSRPLF
jgi:hypothetical protein